MNDLIEKLEAATEGSRELDADIAQHVDWPRIRGAKRLPDRPDSSGYFEISADTWQAVPRYTTSLDAALTLVPEGWGCDLGIWPSGNGARLTPGVNIFHAIYREAQTPALALCIAALKARGEQ